MRISRSVVAAVAGSVVFGAGLAGCSSDSKDSGTSSAAHVDLHVSAAASLKATFTELAKQFESSHPNTTVVLNFGGSSDLAGQINNGAPADVFASADVANMDKVIKTHNIEGTPVNFATNTLTIAVAPGNPKGIHSLEDLTKPDTVVVVCAVPQPCGSATAKVEQAAHVKINARSQEQSVADVLTKVTTGQADAGLVYVTDVAGSKGKTQAVDFPQSSAAVNMYPIGVVAHAAHADLAAEFVALVTGEQGRQVLTKAGFGAP